MASRRLFDNPADMEPLLPEDRDGRLAELGFEFIMNFLSVHDFGFALEFPKEPGRREVLWSDVRYCREDRPASARADCALWFGGEFEQGGRALRQETYVGDWIQQRPPPR